MPFETPFSREQKEWRRKLRMKEQELLGTAHTQTSPNLSTQKSRLFTNAIHLDKMYEQPPAKSHQNVRIKLVSHQTNQADAGQDGGKKDPKQLEIDNYYKFKRKQER